MRRRVELLSAAGAGLVVVAGLLGLVVEPEVALAVGAVGIAAAILGLATALGSVHRRLDTQAERLGRQGRRITAIDRRTGQVLKASRRAARHTDGLKPARARTNRLMTEIVAQMDKDSFRLRTGIDTLPSDILRLSRVTDRLVPGTAGLPGLGDWAVTPATLLEMLDEVYSRPGPVTVLECGSGSSTLFFALALQARGLGGHVVALESDAAFAEETRGHLRAHGVQDLATVVDAPLVEVLAPGEDRAQRWFDVAGLPADLGAIDVLFVDGPVGSTSVQARYPAYPVFADRLAPGALVVLDDTDRPDEKAILERWLDSDGHGRPLTKERVNVRSTFLRAD